MANWPVLVILCAIYIDLPGNPETSIESLLVFLHSILLILGLLCKHVNTEHVTALFDLSKYHENLKLTFASNKTSAELCSDSKNEEYLKCGTKCVLSCEFGSSSSEILSPKDCEGFGCFEGCSCKVGFVRHNDKCIPIKDCPTRANKAIEDATEILNTLEKRRPCLGSGCSSTSDCNDDECSPTPSSGPCNSPGCISIVNHNQAISSGSKCIE